MRKYDLARMLEEIRRDEGSGNGPAKKLLSQKQIKELARTRRGKGARKTPAK
jgi:hypothetical protein